MSVPVFYRKTKVETPENFSEACSIFGFFLLKNCKKCFLLHIFNIRNLNVIFRIGVLIDL
ncbi:hypothetical protein EY686_06190 [Enterococcus faecalis]|nr:hypothetical protein [Enterococcus faecalis]